MPNPDRNYLRDLVILTLKDNGSSLSAIGREIRVSRERVRQLYERALNDATREDKGVARWIVRNDLFRKG